MKKRLDQEVANRGLTISRSQAENLIRMGKVVVDKKIVTKPGTQVSSEAKIKIKNAEQYVSRAAYKLQSVAQKLKLDFRGKTILDVGSSTGGFTDYALRKGATKSIAVDVGTNQLHPSLRGDERIELHEKTDIRDFANALKSPLEEINIVVIDVSFISLKEVLPSIKKIIRDAEVVAMVKPQFEAGKSKKNKGIIKNDKMRRDVLKDFESWVKNDWVIENKADSEVSGAKGNRERFYLLKPG